MMGGGGVSSSPVGVGCWVEICDLLLTSHIAIYIYRERETHTHIYIYTYGIGAYHSEHQIGRALAENITAATQPLSHSD